MQALTILALSLWIFRIWLSKRYRLFWPPACWAVSLFLAYAVVRTSQADLPYVAHKELARVGLYAGVFILLINNACKQDALLGFTYLWAGLGFLISAYAVYQFATESNHVWMFVRPASYGTRGSGTYICPNHFAGFLVMVLPLASAVVLDGRLSLVPRIALGYCCLAMVAGLTISVSRGGWLAGAVGLGALAFLHFTRRHRAWRVWVLLAALALAFAIVARVSPSVTDRARGLLEEQYTGSTIDTRLSLWTSTSRMWRDHPWLGVGPGHFDYRFPAYRLPSVQARPAYAHNDYLNTLADWGTVGLALAFSALCITLVGVIRAAKYFTPKADDLGHRPSNRWAILVGASAGLLGLMAHSVVDFNLQVPANALLAVILLAMLNSLLRFTTERYWMRLRWWSKALVSLAVVVMIGFLGLQGVQSANESYYLRKVAQEKTQNTARLEALQQAFRVQPDNFETAHALGEAFRQRSFQGLTGYTQDAERALVWYATASRLNPYDPYNPARIGMCLDWLDRHEEALPYYDQALQLDPNNHYLRVLRGWHELEVGAPREALKWFYRSRMVYDWPNPLARTYTSRARQMLREDRVTPMPQR